MSLLYKIKTIIFLIVCQISQHTFAEQVNFGENSTVLGRSAAAFGNSTSASGYYSAAFGVGSSAYGVGSTAFGYSSYVSGEYATVFGQHTEAAGSFSTAFGFFSVADAMDSVTIGRLNYQYPDVDPYLRKPSDPIFIVGNGTLGGNRSNAFTVFANGITEVYGPLSVYGPISQTSDERLKTDINPSPLGLNEILALDAVTYTLTRDESNRKRVGFIAQDLELVLPELVTENREGYKSVDYGQLTAVLVEAVKELQQQNTVFQSEMATLKQENLALRKEVRILNTKVK